MQGVGVADGYVARLVEIVELPLQIRYGGVYHLETCNSNTSKFFKMISLSQRRYFIRLTLGVRIKNFICRHPGAKSHCADVQP